MFTLLQLHVRSSQRLDLNYLPLIGYGQVNIFFLKFLCCLHCIRNMRSNIKKKKTMVMKCSLTSIKHTDVLQCWY